MKKIKYVMTIIIISIIVIYFYTFLHESGHAIIALRHGGEITKFQLGLDANVEFMKTRFTDTTYAVMKIFGIIFPVIVMYFLLLIYNRNLKSKVYHLFYAMFCIMVTSSLITCIIIPVMFKMYNLTPGDDVVDFLYKYNVEPLYVSVTFLCIFIFNIFILFKRGIIDNLIKIKEESL